jgi:tetratricopeptide (TPR) repeat protein
LEGHVRRQTIATVLAAAALAAAASPSAAIPGRSFEILSEAVGRMRSADAWRVAQEQSALEIQDIVRQEITVCVDPADAWLEADCRLWIETDRERVGLLLDRNLNVTSVSDSRGFELRHTRRAESLEILANEGAGAFPLEIIISYRGPVGGSSDGELSDGALVLGDLVLLGPEFHWYPASTSRDAARLRIEVRYPPGYSSVATGTLTGMATSRPGHERCVEGDVWQVPTPVAAACLVVGRFVSSLTVLGDVFVGSHWVSDDGAGDGAVGEAALPVEDLTELVHYLEACNGSYPYGWLNAVTLPGVRGSVVSGPGFVAVGADPDEGPARPLAGRLASGVLDSWWRYHTDAGRLIGDGVSAKTEVDWLEATGEKEAASRLRDDRRWRFMTALQHSGSAVSLADCLDAESEVDDDIRLGKGADVFEMLSMVVGQDAYCAALRGLSEERGGASAGLGDLMDVFERESGQDLDWFFYEWLWRDDLPSYAVDYQIVENEEGALIARGVIAQEGQFYRTPVPLTIDLGGWSYDELVEIGSSQQPFEISVDERPVAITIDEGRVIPRIDRLERARMHHERGKAAVSDDDWKRAVDEFGAAATLDPGNAAFLRSYGVALVRSGWRDEGLGRLEVAAALSPDDAGIRLELATLYLRSGDHASALAHLDVGLPELSDDPAVDARRVEALVGLGRLDEAGAVLSRALALAAEAPVDPDLDAALLYVSGLVFEAAGETESAAAEYEAALSASPVLDEARRRLRLLRLGE